MIATKYLKNGALGVVAMIVVGLVPMIGPVAPLVGGGVAGYRQREDVKGGAIAGLVSGLLWTLLTLVLLIVVVVGAGLTAPPGVGPLNWLPAAGGGLYVGVLFAVMNAGVCAATTLGGAIGGALVKEAQRPTPPREVDV
ncbi:hypothetical protein SAMN04487948_101149 [Halogranum amylolyticum]|uniref:Uncharacterized protein n=1 Tax=Halogranum amylolyticum TaxID=660520 RepID=A0A1H8MWL1_9EURY|nr:DUF5518 domain-containing protein [Halogranum amylolyticum]SEO21801.1 hypothetical protein SAMN04487948_101149 [Halogranum amylolyticum]